MMDRMSSQARPPLSAAAAERLERLFRLYARSARRGIGHYYRVRRNQEQPVDWTDALASSELPVTPPADGDALVLADLSASQCTALKLAAQGLSYRAIASRMGRSRGAVYSHLHRGARKLRASVALDPPRPSRSPSGPVRLPLPRRTPGQTNPPTPAGALAEQRHQLEDPALEAAFARLAPGHPLPDADPGMPVRTPARKPDRVPALVG